MEKSQVITTQSADEARLCVSQMLEQARYRIEIVSTQLDPTLYDQQAVVESLRQVVVRGRHRSLVRILVADANALVQRGHRALELVRQLTSFMEIRQLSEDDASNHPGSFLVVDSEDYLAWKQDAGYHGKGRYDHRGYAARWGRQFDELWNRAHIPSALRRLYL